MSLKSLENGEVIVEGNFSGHTLTKIDPETGFLERPEPPVYIGKDLYQGGGTSPSNTFNASRKAHFLNHLFDLWPDFSAACRASHIGRTTVFNHLSIDESFRECVDEIRMRTIDRVHAARMKQALKPAGAFDRMTVLNAHMPELYNPKTQIEVQHTVEMKGRADALEKVVDAQIVGTVQRLKKERQKRIAA